MNYKAKENLKHNGVRYAIGQSIEVGEEEAEKMLANGLITSEDSDIVVEAPEAPQPAVNEVKRDGDQVKGKRKVKKGKKTEVSEEEANKL